jgi:adenylate cyclase
MAISDRTRIGIPLIPRLALIGALGGATYGYLTTTGFDGAGALGIERGILIGGLVSVAITALNIWVLLAPIGAGFRNAPFLIHIGLKSLIYLIIFIASNWIGQWLISHPRLEGPRIVPLDVLFFFAFSFVLNFLMDLNSLLGQNVLLNFVTGRYFRPHVERRVFLFIDMRNSTAAAERLGEVAFHRLLNRFVSDLTGPIVIHKGQIHKYVGDELIVTWPLEAGLKDARCLRACFAALRQMIDLGPSYEREFGLRVSFRAGLHCGPIVIGEMGTIKKEIALIGDTMNTTARIVDACRGRDVSVLASAALLNQITAPAGIVASALGPIQLRGRTEPVELFALKGAG